MNSHLYTQAEHPTSAERTAIRLALEGYRRQWQDASKDNSLVDVVAPVGLVIADIAESLGLTNEERRAVLGARLDADVSQLLKQQVQLKQ